MSLFQIQIPELVTWQRKGRKKEEVLGAFRGRSGGAILGLFLTFALPSMLTGMLMGFGHGFNLALFTSKFGAQSAYTIANWVGFIAIVALLKRKLGIQLNDLGFRHGLTKVDILAIIGFAAAGIGLFIGLDYLFVQLGMGMPAMEYHITGAGDLIPLVIYAVISAPICEESFFRAYGINCLRGLSNRTWLAVLISLIGFGAIHLFSHGLRGFIEIGLIWGILPSVLYLWRKNIYPGITMHSLNNLFFYIIVPLYIPSLALAS